MNKIIVFVKKDIGELIAFAKDIWLGFAEIKRETDEAIHFAKMSGYPPTVYPYPIEYAWTLAKYTEMSFNKYVVCPLIGHRMDSDSCVGPDSASEDIWCTRCDFHQHITYY